MLSNFSTTTHGKWILCGEHAVLRGSGALVFPILDKTLNFQYENEASIATNKKLIIHATYLGTYNPQISKIIEQLLTKAFNFLNIQTITGTITVDNNIETGLGMGSSAALCVAIARWLKHAGFIKDTYLFAKSLENFFHGQSSGLDIAGVETGKGVYFQNGNYSEIQQTWSPIWKLSSCGETSTTASCISKVQTLWEQNKTKAQEIDINMQKSVKLAKYALENQSPQSITDLTKAIQTANECFQKWGLITEPMQTHMQNLLNQGAKAVKPTGSGGGGLVVSLWG